MGKTKNGTRYPEELRARAVRMVLHHIQGLSSNIIISWHDNQQRKAN